MTSVVTIHAVYRWLTRFMDIPASRMAELAERFGPTPTECEMVFATCQHLGVTLEQIQEEMAPAHVQTAIRGGASKVIRNGFTLICANGVVSTVIVGRYDGPQRGHKAAQRRFRRPERRRERVRHDWLAEAAE